MPSTGIAMQGISAAIVYTAIDRISEMINTADASMASALNTEVNAALRAIPGRSPAAGVKYRPEYQSAERALSGATLAGTGPGLDRLPLFLDNVVGSFFEDYNGKLDAMFPGLGIAGADADEFVRRALRSALGVSYDEFVDSTQADTAFMVARQERFAKDREMLDAVAAAGHRFAPGAALESMARMHGLDVAAGTTVIEKAYAQRLAQERSEKMRLVAASMGTNMDRIKKLHKQVADAFRLKLQARGMWINDQNAVVDIHNNKFQMSERFNTLVTTLARETATRRFGLEFERVAVSDRDEFLGKLKMSNATEVVDLFGNIVTTLQNQVQGRGAYQGNERDVTDWDSLLA